MRELSTGYTIFFSKVTLPGLNDKVASVVLVLVKFELLYFFATISMDIKLGTPIGVFGLNGFILGI